MHFHPMTQQLYDQLQNLYAQYGQHPPPPPKRSLNLCSDEQLIASTCMYEAGPFLLCEWFVIRPTGGLRARHRAAEVLIEGVIAYAGSQGLMPIAIPRSKGLKAMMARYGFQDTRQSCMTMQMPLAQVTDESPARLQQRLVSERRKAKRLQAGFDALIDENLELRKETPHQPEPHRNPEQTKEAEADGANQRSRPATGPRPAKKRKKSKGKKR